MLGKYLVAIAKLHRSVEGPATPKDIRLLFGIILVISDVLHAAKFHVKAFEVPVGVLTPYISELTNLAAQSIIDTDKTSEKKLKAIIQFWRLNEVLNGRDLHEMEQRVRQSLRRVQRATAPEVETSHAPPQTFGERKSTWYGLPATYILRSTFRNSFRPVDTYTIRPTEPNTHQSAEVVDELFNEYLNSSGRSLHSSTNGGSGIAEQYKQWFIKVGELVKANEAEGKETSGITFGFSTDIGDEIDGKGVPQGVIKMRTEYDRGVDDEAFDRGRSNSRPYTPPRSRFSYQSPSGRQNSSPHDDERGRYRSRSRSPYGSRNDRPGSRESYEDLRDQDRGPRYDDGNRNQYRSSRDYGRDAPPHLSKFSNSDGQSSTSDIPEPNATYGGPYTSTGGPSNNNAPSFPPPFPPQFPGQFPMPPFPPPFPPGSMPGIPPPPPPPPPNFNPQFPNTFPPVHGFPQDAFNAFGSRTNYQNQSGSSQPGPGYGNFSQGPLQGAGLDPGQGQQGHNQRGGYMSNNRRGNYQGTNHRGGYRGASQRGNY